MKSVIRNSVFGALAIAAVAIAVQAPAVAEETNPSIVHRQAMFKTIAGNLTALKAILLLKHEAAGDVATHAMGIKESLERVKNDFPEGSDKGETNALPEIWMTPEKFQDAYKNALTKADALVAATKGDDAAAQVAAFKEMAGACKTCHDDFRKKQ